jgi:hypothetical protein
MLSDDSDYLEEDDEIWSLSDDGDGDLLLFFTFCLSLSFFAFFKTIFSSDELNES